MKKCTNCNVEKDINEFTRKRSDSEERRAICKDCKRDNQREYQRTDSGKEVFRKAQMKYKKTDNGKEKTQEYLDMESTKEKYRIYSHLNRLKYPQKVKARNDVLHAIERGDIEKLPCQYPNCKHYNKRIEGHHWDYNKTLDVVWLCSTHHRLADNIYKIINNYVRKIQ